MNYQYSMRMERESRITPVTSFREFLQLEFVSRCRKNPRYSLRAYAKSLGIAPSPLSAILRGRRKISEKMMSRLGMSLGLSQDDLLKMKGYKENTQKIQQLALDTFNVMADWYHYAILELTKVRGFKPDPILIAKALDITVNEVRAAVERLKNLGLLEIKRGRWIDTSADVVLSNIHGDETSSASRLLQSQVLEKALNALHQTLPNERNHTSMTVAINPRSLPEAKKRIQIFRRELCSFLEMENSPTQVYHLGITFYPVSKPL